MNSLLNFIQDRNLSWLLICWIASLSGCKEKTLSPTKYFKYIENESNGLRIVKTIDQYEFSLQYKPSDYMALRNISNYEISPDDYKKEKSKYLDLLHFNLKISVINSNKDIFLSEGVSEEESNRRLEYFSYPAQNDIQLKIGNSVLPCNLYHFERSHNMEHFCNLVLGFKATTNPTEGMTLSYDDKVLGTGKVNFKIDGSSLKNIPSVELK